MPIYQPPPLAARAGMITGRLLVALLFFALGIVLTFFGIEVIRSDVEAFATWRTTAGGIAMFMAGGLYGSVGSIVLRAFRP